MTQFCEVPVAGKVAGMSRVLTIQQVMSCLQVSDETVYRHIRSGRLKALRVGRLWRIPERSLVEFLERSSQ